MDYAIYSMTKKTKKSKKGFTLIELVVVIAILGILAAILIPVIGGFIKRANESADKANARSLFNAVSILLSTDEDPATGGAAYDATALGEFVDLSASAGEWSYNVVESGGAYSVDYAEFGVATYYSDGSYVIAS